MFAACSERRRHLIEGEVRVVNFGVSFVSPYPFLLTLVYVFRDT